MSGNNRSRNSSSIYTGNPNNLEAGRNNLEAGPSSNNNFVNLEMGLGQNTSSGNPVVHQNSSSEMMDPLSTGDLHVTHDTTREEDLTHPTLTSYGSFSGFSGTPNITGSTTHDRSSFGNVSGLTLPNESVTLPSQSMSLSNSSNPEQEPPFNASFSTIGNHNNNSSIVGNPTGVNMIQHTPRSASSPYNSNTLGSNNNNNGSNNNNNTLGGKKKRKTKKVNRKQKKTKKVKRKVKKTMKKKQRKTKRKVKK